MNPFDNRRKVVPIKYIGTVFKRHPEWVDRLYGTKCVWTEEMNIQLIPEGIAKKMLKFNSDVYAKATEADIKAKLREQGEQLIQDGKDISIEMEEKKKARRKKETLKVELENSIRGMMSYEALEQFVMSTPELEGFRFDRRKTLPKSQQAVIDHLKSFGKVM